MRNSPVVQAMVIRRQKVRKDVLSGAMSSGADLARRYGVSVSTIENDLLSITEGVRMEMEKSLPGEWAKASARLEANALRALNAFEESRRQRKDCKTCETTGWVKGVEKKGKPYKVKKVKCPRKFQVMAREDGLVPEHRLVVAREIDRCLTKEEVVHHIDMDGRNNKPKNLMLFRDNSDHRQFHSGVKVTVVWTGTLGVRPVESKDWCGDCNGEGFTWYNIPGDPRFLTEYRNSIVERSKLLGLYPKTESFQRHLHLHGASQGKVDAAKIPSEMILDARIFQDELVKHSIDGEPVEVDDVPDEESEEE